MDKSTIAQQFLEVFSGFKHLHWKQIPVKGLMPSEIMVMICLKKHTADDSAGMTVSGISKMLKVTPPTVTQLINKLEASGFVERYADKKDRRSVRVKLSGKGLLTIKKAYAAILSSLDGLAAHLGETKSRQLVALLSEVFDYYRNSQNKQITANAKEEKKTLC